MTPFDPNLKMNDLEMSEKAKPLFEAVKAHIRDNMDPITEEYFALGATLEDRWSFHPKQLELLDGAKKKARRLSGHRCQCRSTSHGSSGAPDRSLWVNNSL